ncbi:MAG: sugar phosphate isomerase/epimerase [Treponema sp.]|jgi:sugar phosphate isomerase/epimerase|nr:sugar phosphate isomerase/epimerase [Treponema sp.]
MKIGVQTYTIREYLKSAQEINASLKRIKEIGFDLVQLSGLGPVDPDELALMLRDNGITAAGTHSPWDRISEKDKLAKLIDEHKKWGCSQIGLGAKPPSYPHTYEGYTGFINKINDICSQITEAGLSFGYHNHEFEFMKFNGERAIDRMIKECPKCEFTLDVFWVQAGGANPNDYIDKLQKRIRILHLKDFRIFERERQFAEIGQGNLDWKEIFSRCKQYDIPYAVIEQDANFLVDPFESLALSRKFLVDNGYWE